MSIPQLIICGSIAIDRIMNFSGHYKDLVQPDKLHVLSLSVLLDRLEQTKGGVAANIAYGLAQLGEQPVLLGSAGKDAADYMRELTDAGVDTSHLHHSQLPTASFNVITDADGNQVGGFYPGAMGDSGSLSLAPWAGQDVLACVSAHDPEAMRRQIGECAEHGIRLVYDPGQQVSNVPGEDLRAGVEAAEVLILNDYEFGVLCSKTSLSETEVKAKVPVVITTYGKAGSLIEGSSLKEAIKISIAQPAQAADPTGAGDAYRAGFLYGYLRQWELRACGQLGAVTASFIVEQHGTQHALSKPAIIKRYQKTYNEETML